MQTKELAKAVFKSKALAVFRHVEETGEPVIVTDHGQPTIEIRRIAPRDGAALARLKGTIARYDDPTAPVGESEWEALTETQR